MKQEFSPIFEDPTVSTNRPFEMYRGTEDEPVYVEDYKRMKFSRERTTGGILTRENYPEIFDVFERAIDELEGQDVLEKDISKINMAFIFERMDSSDVIVHDVDEGRWISSKGSELDYAYLEVKEYTEEVDSPFAHRIYGLDMEMVYRGKEGFLGRGSLGYDVDVGGMYPGDQLLEVYRLFDGMFPKNE